MTRRPDDPVATMSKKLRLQFALLMDYATGAVTRLIAERCCYPNFGNSDNFGNYGNSKVHRL